MPAAFDPRAPAGVPEAKAGLWFYVDDDGVRRPAVSGAMDQAGCGSCWAFSFASATTDRIRLALIKRLGAKKACLQSSFFELLDVCTGESGVEASGGSGVTNKGAGSKLYGVEVRDRISPYWVVGFAPKMRDSCPVQGFETCVRDECSAALTLWRRAAATMSHADAELVHASMGASFPSCMGCEGNHIAMPLIMMTDPAGGAAALSQFPVQDWACLFGDAGLRKIYCEPEAGHPVPKLFHADRYMYATADDMGAGFAPAGVKSMEHWIQAEVFNVGPVSIGFSVYQSFMDFFARHPHGVWTARDFMLDRAAGLAAWGGKYPGDPEASDSDADAEKKMRTNMAPRGGHAVVIVGWGESTADAGAPTSLPGLTSPRPVKYWIVRNSWGPSWGDSGFFRIERNMDAALGAPLVGFEAELGGVYFAPDPAPAAYEGGDGVANNPMADFSTGPPSAHCVGEHHHVGDLADELKAKCSCPHDHIRVGGRCVRDPDGRLEAKMLFGTSDGVRRLNGLIGGSTASSKKKVLLLILLLVLVIGAAMGLKKWSGGRPGAGRAGAAAPASSAASSASLG